MTHQRSASTAFVTFLLFACCALGTRSSAAAPAIFDNVRTIRVAGGTVLGIRAADFNHDARPDFALLHIDKGAAVAVLSVYLGNGDGTFRDQAVTSVGPASTFEVANLDGDAFPDVVVSWRASSDAGEFQTYLGKGDGTFNAAGSPFSTAPRSCNRTMSFALADMTGDGRSDIVACTVIVFPSVGGGAFGTSIVTQTAFISGAHVHVLDANGDGKRDVLLANSPTSQMLLGHGDGTFGSPVVVASGEAAAAADFNGDGRDDLTWIDRNNHDRGVGLASIDGSFSARTTAGFVPDAAGRGDLVAADVNGDLRPDVVLGAASHVYVWLTRPDGSAEGPHLYVAGTSAAVIAVADFDGDGKADVLAAGGSGSTWEPSASVCLLPGNGDGTLRANEGWPLSYRSDNVHFVGESIRGATVSDVTRDGFMDVIAVSDRAISVLAGAVGGGFGPATVTNISGGTSPVQPFFADFDGDGAMDVLLNREDSSRYECWLSSADGTHRQTAAVDVTIRFSGPVATGDFNGDRFVDFVEIGFDRGARFHSGRGDGTFGPEVVTVSAAIAGSDVRVGDVNGDGRDDLAGAYGFLLGLADGHFTRVPYDNSFNLPFLIDLNRDGKLDLVTRESFPDRATIAVRLGHGDFTFGRRSTLELDVPGVMSPITMSDFDGDGNADLAFGTTLLLGDGAGWFDGYARFEMYGIDGSVALGDVDRNGSPDLVVISASTHSLDVIRTRTRTSLGLPLTVELGPARATTPMGDLFEVNATGRRNAPFTPRGAVVFRFRGRATAMSELFDETARGRVRPVTVGSQSLTAAYWGDDVYSTSNVAAATVDVTRGQPWWEPSVFPSALRSSDSLHVSSFVDTAVDDPPATGTVTVTVDGVVRGTGAPPFFNIEIGKYSTGNHQLLLEYSGDENYLPLSYTAVLAVKKPAVNMQFSASPSGVAKSGEPVTLKVSFPDDPALTGSVRFNIGTGSRLGPIGVANGVGSVTTTLLPLGTYEITAVFGGNAQYSETTVTIQYSVVKSLIHRRGVRS